MNPISDEVRQSAAELFAHAPYGRLQEIVPFAGGRNNRVYRLVGETGVGILKHYMPTGLLSFHDRFAAEVNWLRYCQHHGVSRVPQLWGFDSAARCTLFAEIPGRKLTAGEVQPRHVAQAADFYRELNAHRESDAAYALDEATEACFSLDMHRRRIELRIQRLQSAPVTDDLAAAMQDWLTDSLQPTWRTICSLWTNDLSASEWEAALPREAWRLSPSDFGFHNALVTDNRSVWFLDFEYAGWDDPAKMVCDFYWQVDVPVPRSTASILLATAAEKSPDLTDRVVQLFPAYGIKWCTIVLNEFLDEARGRRDFAAGDRQDGRAPQFERARRLLLDVQHVMQQGAAAALALSPSES